MLLIPLDEKFLVEKNESIKLLDSKIEEQILDEPLEAPKLQSIGYTPEPVAEEIKPQCGVGTKLVDGICKIIKTDEPKFCFLFWCW